MDAKDAGQRNLLRILADAVYGMRDRVTRLNPAQKKVLFGMVFFFLVNAAIIVACIILVSKLVKKL